MIKTLGGTAEISDDGKERLIGVPRNSTVKLYIEGENVKINAGGFSRLTLIDNKLRSRGKNSLVINLSEGAELKYFGLFYGNKKQNLESSLKVNHNGRNAKSSILSCEALDDYSVSAGKITVRISKSAVNSATTQKSNILLLSGSAKAVTSPQLEIEEESADAVHGASISKLNPEKMFYLMSRGLTDEEAKKKMVLAFFNPLISEISDKKLAQGLKCIISSKLK